MEPSHGETGGPMPIDALLRRLQGLDGQDYGAYQSLIGAWRYPDFELHIDRIPKDPYAPPHTGVYRVRIPVQQAGVPATATASRVREIAFRDYLTRQVHRRCRELGGGRRGTGNSGLITIAEPGQEILERTSVVLEGGHIEARMFLGLPASERAIWADIAAAMLGEELPRIVRAALFVERLEPRHLERHLAAAEDSDCLRRALPALGLVAFVGDGALLPRASGVEARPLEGAGVVPFRAPESLRVRIEVPHAGPLTGMGIPAGVTLIVGGGYHGKSTLLQALEGGVYDHIPGDGRERCVSLAGTQKIRAASGRSVAGTDISAFIAEIPLGAATTCFSTPNASGSTSQAASIVEAMEVGAELLLMDEDTSATNFMIRDERMQALVSKQHEPITAFVDRVRQLHGEHGLSTVLVMGGSGDYFAVADCVIQMVGFEPRDVTREARAISARLPTARAREGTPTFAAPRARRPLGAGLDPHNEYGHLRITATQPHGLTFGREAIDLSDVEQLVDAAQTRAIGRAMLHLQPRMNGGATFHALCERLIEDLRREGLDVLDPERTGNLAGFRALEWAAALNRVRSLAVTQAP